jgi:hypothetical protein
MAGRRIASAPPGPASTGTSRSPPLLASSSGSSPSVRRKLRAITRLIPRVRPTFPRDVDARRRPCHVRPGGRRRPEAPLSSNRGSAPCKGDKERRERAPDERSSRTRARASLGRKGSSSTTATRATGGAERATVEPTRATILCRRRSRASQRLSLGEEIIRPAVEHHPSDDLEGDCLLGDELRRFEVGTRPPVPA